MNNSSVTTPEATQSGVSHFFLAADTTIEVLKDLQDRFPGSPFLALGQTALWDEPTKAALRRILDHVNPDARLIAASHDTDYFAKLPGHPPAKEHGKYAIVLHDDARTRGLWSAAGEMSRLFGSEDVPTRAALETQGGVALHRAVFGAADPNFLISELTAAWGWTGIIYTHWDRKISRDVPLSDIYLALRDQIDWAIDGTVECLQGERADKAKAIGQTIKDAVRDYAHEHPEASLTELYEQITPRFYEMLLGHPAANLETSSTSKLLKINRATASLPRFQFVELFLNPITRRPALDAYNLAIGGSEMYTLDRFGEGALPFDLVIPGQGRGTLCIRPNGTIYVDTPQPITLCDEGCDFATVEKLASLIERELGPDCVLIGKAVSLLPMLAAEFILVFHEGASGYTDRTSAMVAHLARRNIAMPVLRPILRVKYAAWDSLTAVPPMGPDERDEANQFRLPEFLAQAFGDETIPLTEFGACWRCAINHQQDRLNELSTLGSPRDLLTYLSDRDETGVWAGKAREYDAAIVALMRLRDEAQAIQGRVYTFYDQMRAEKSAVNRLEHAKGEDFRARVQPLRDRMAEAQDAGEIARLQAEIDRLQAERALQFDAEIASRRGQVRYSLVYVRDLKEKRLALERGETATQSRQILRRIEAEAEMSKARLARNALQTIHGLPHTNFRPSSWWLALVDPSGSWFDRLAQTAELWIEPLSPPAK